MAQMILVAPLRKRNFVQKRGCQCKFIAKEVNDMRGVAIILMITIDRYLAMFKNIQIVHANSFCFFLYL